MPEPAIRGFGEVAVGQTNELFRQADKPLVACLLNELDLEWCISAIRNMSEERQLPQDQIGAILRDDSAFNFYFKLLDARHRPAGACICEYYPRDGMLNVEMLQNLQIRPSIPDGNMLKFTLYAIALFLLETEGSSVRLAFPVSQVVTTYYIEEHGLLDITDDGSRDILYRSMADLVDWFGRDTALVGGKRFISDNVRQHTQRAKELDMVTRKRRLVASKSPLFQVPETTQVHKDGDTESVVRGRSDEKVTFTTPKDQKTSASEGKVFNVLLNSAKSTRQPRSISEDIYDLTRYKLFSKQFKGRVRGLAQLLDSLMGGVKYSFHAKVVNKYTDYTRCGQLHTGQSCQSRLEQ